MKKKIVLLQTLLLLAALLSGCSSGLGSFGHFEKDETLYQKAAVSEQRLNELAERVSAEREQKALEEKAPEQKALDQNVFGQNVLGQNALGQTALSISLPADSTVFDPAFATNMLYISLAGDAQTAKQLFESMGMKVVLQANYDKPKESEEHTSAYTVGTMKAERNGEERNIVLVSIRGTNAGEWYSNFDFAPSHSEETQYAENFMMAAQDIATGIAPVLMQTPDPIIVITGHSRGAACANLLGSILDGQLPISDVFVYTSATPATVRGAAALQHCPNIFNLINPCDVVPMMPLSQWGYSRLGTDIILPGDEAEALRIAGSMQSLYKIAPTITSYYSDVHSLAHQGMITDDTDTGMTTHEAMRSIADSFMTMYSAKSMDELMKFDRGSSEIFANSDFKLLFELYASALERGTIFSEHLQNKYITLLKDT